MRFWLDLMVTDCLTILKEKKNEQEKNDDDDSRDDDKKRRWNTQHEKQYQNKKM